VNLYTGQKVTKVKVIRPINSFTVNMQYLSSEREGLQTSHHRRAPLTQRSEVKVTMSEVKVAM